MKRLGILPSGRGSNFLAKSYSSPLLSQTRLLYSLSMERERILGILREHEPELKASGVVHLRLFGSVARGESTSSSDVDLLAEFDQVKPLTLQSLAKIEYQLDDLLGIKVDLSSADSMYPPIRTRALAEAIVAF